MNTPTNTLYVYVSFNQSSGKTPSDFLDHFSPTSANCLQNAKKLQAYARLKELLPQTKPQASHLTGSETHYSSTCRNTGVIPNCTQQSALQHPRLQCELWGQGRVNIKPEFL